MNTNKVFYQLSESQKSIWYLEKAYPETSLNIVAGNLRLKGEIDYSALEKALNIFVKKNDAMRLRIHEEDGIATQSVAQYEKFKVEHLDFSRSGGLKELFLWDEGKTRTPFNITDNPLFYCATYKVSDEEGGFYVKMHHLISDAWTMGLATRQLIDLYSKIRRNETVDDSPGPSFIEHLTSEAEYEKSDRFENDKAYWSRKFDTLPEMTVLKPPKTGANSISARRKTLITPLKLSNKIREFCAVNKVSVFTLFMSALSIYINRVTGIEDIVLGTTILNRTNFKEKETPGMFVSVAAPVRISIDDSMDFITFAKAMLKENTDVLRHQKYPYNYIIRDLKNKHKFSNALFDIVLNYQNSKFQKDETETAYTAKWIFSGSQLESLIISVNDREDSGNLIIDYDFLTDVFNIKEIEFIHQHIISLLWHALDNPVKRISKLDMISEKEKRMILQEFNNTYVNYPREKTVNQLFEEQASRTPDNTALVFQDERMTYRELNERANALAHRLRNCGIGPDIIVGLMVNRSFEMIIGIIGVLKAGGAYLPIDPDYPSERKAYMLEDSDAKVLLTNREFINDVAYDGTVIDLFDDANYAADLKNPDNKNKPSDMSYLIYTSGSTGKPKGTMIPHKAVVNYCFKARSNVFNFAITEDLKRIVSITTISFDIFVTESLLPLLNGMTVILANETEQNRQDKLNTLIVRQQAEVIQTTPSKMSLLISDNKNLEFLDVLKVIILGGEALPPAFIQNLKSLTSARIFNAYGPTETTVWSSISDLQSETVMIGRPIANTQIYILDRNLNLLPIGIPGDIYIAGEGLSSGYFRNSALTNEKFIFNHFMNFGRMYNTGDVGYWKSKGEIVYIGRNDHQIKLRGLRIELGEIETQLLAHESVKSAVVNGIVKAGCMNYLCAYIIPENHFDEQQVRQHLKQRLPEYMIPSCFIMVDDFPMTANGKIDRTALPEPDFNDSIKSGHEPPANETEAEIARIWGRVLEVDDTGVLDDYYALGGDSLKSIKIIVEINKTFGIDISSRNMLRCSNIRELAGMIEGLEKKQDTIPNAPISNCYPVSAAQKRQYILNKLDGGISYNLPGGLLIEGRLDLSRLNFVFKSMLNRQESLRTSFEMRDGEPVQIIHDTIDFRVEYLESDETEKDDLMTSFVRPFDLSVAPLLRARLVRFSEENHVLLVDMHHIISDGASINIIAKEFAALYNGDGLPELRIQYKDYSVWHNEFLKSEKIKKQEAYWRERFTEEIPVLNMPLDYARPSVQSFKGNKLQFTIDEKMTGRIRALTAATGTTLFMFLLSSYNVLLSKYTGQEDIVIGTPVEGRHHADLRGLIGMFVNTLAIRSYPAGDKTFKTFLNEVKEDFLNAYDNQEYPFEALVEKVGVKRDMSRNPLFDTTFVLQNMDLTRFTADGFTAAPYSYINKTSKFDLTLEVADQGTTIEYSIEYCTDLFAEETIKRLAGHFTNAINDILEYPDKRISDINVLSDLERRQLLYDFNNTDVNYPREKTIQQLFEEQVARTPDDIALIFKESEMTYAQLNEKANALANKLQSYGVGPDRFVGIMVNRSFEMIIAMLAVLKAGGAYLPIDPDYPDERKAYMLEDSGTEVLLTKREYFNDVFFGGTMIDLFDMASYTSKQTNSEVGGKPTDLAYIIYTSGSTGRPKGTLIPQKAVINYCHRDRLNILGHVITEDVTRIVSVTTISFDIFVTESLLPLLNGLTVILADEHEQNQQDRLSALIIRHQAEVIQTTPSKMSLLVSDKDNLAYLSVLKVIILGGEPLTQSFLQKLRSMTSARIYNVYGPTETTVWSSISDLDSDIITIGRPVANTQIYILDRNLNLLPAGIPGDIYIAGEGLCSGYYKNDALKDERFVFNHYLNVGIMYNTGDVGYWKSSGEIVYIGRNDHQIKLRGLRIELGEIETQLMAHESIKSAVVNGIAKDGCINYLCAYVIPENHIDEQQVRHYLKQRLPEYMVPSRFVMLDEFPYTSNGKINRNALPTPDYTHSSDSGYEPPANDIEAELAKIWSDILDVRDIGVLDDYTAMGGDSLKAIMIITSIKRKWGIEVSLKDIFSTKNIRDLARQIDDAGSNRYTPIPKVAESDWYPVSSAQKREYLEYELYGGATFHITNGIKIDGNFHTGRIKDIFKIITSRHEALRTSFAIHEGVPVQIIHEDVDFDVEECHTDETDIDKLMTSFIRPFDLTIAPLFRIKVIRHSENKYLLIMDVHHIISDGASMNIIMREFVELLYGRALIGPDIQYKDYSNWQNKYIMSEDMQKQKAFWLSRLSGEIPVLDMPLDYARPSCKSMAGNRIFHTISEELTNDIKRLASKMEATLYMVLMSAYGVLLSKYSGQEDIIMGIVVEGRNHPDLRDIVGVFVNTPVVRSYPTGEKTFMSYLCEVKEELISVYENQDYPFEELMKNLDLKRDISRNPLFDTLFNMWNTNTPRLVTDDFTMEPHPFSLKASKVDISIGVLENGATLTYYVEYSTALFKANTMARLIKHYEQILCEIVRNPQKKLNDIRLESDLVQEHIEP